MAKSLGKKSKSKFINLCHRIVPSDDDLIPCVIEFYSRRHRPVPLYADRPDLCPVCHLPVGQDSIKREREHLALGRVVAGAEERARAVQDTLALEAFGTGRER